MDVGSNFLSNFSPSRRNKKKATRAYAVFKAKNSPVVGRLNKDMHYYSAKLTMRAEDESALTAGSNTDVPKQI